MLYNKDWERGHVSRILLRAADLIEQHGHVKKRLGNLNDGMCVNGAIYEAADQHMPDFGLAGDALASHLGCRCVVIWNNAPERTGQEVIDALRLAAKLLLKN